MQRFVDTLDLINKIMDDCFDDTFDQYLNHILDNSYFIEIDALIDDCSKKTAKLFNTLREQTRFEDCIKIIKGISLKEKFILHEYLTVGALYDNFYIQRKPILLSEKLPFDLFSYIETSYQLFDRICKKRHVSTSDEVFSLSLDNSEKQNT